jgi:hypothetical protein
MTALVEMNRNEGFLTSEDPGKRSRDNISLRAADATRDALIGIAAVDFYESGTVVIETATSGVYEPLTQYHLDVAEFNPSEHKFAVVARHSKPGHAGAITRDAVVRDGLLVFVTSTEGTLTPTVAAPILELQGIVVRPTA